MRDELVKRIGDVIYTGLGDLPGVMVDNDLRINWGVGYTFTFKLGLSEVLVYSDVIIFRQRLDVYFIGDGGKQEYVGETDYVMYLTEGDILEYLIKYKSTPDYRLSVLGKAFEYAVDRRIKGFGLEGLNYRGCKFVTNDVTELVTTDELYEAIISKFRERLEGFFSELLLQGEFVEGDYRITIRTVEVGYSEGKDLGWGVLLVVECQNFSTLVKREVDIVLHTGIQASERDPTLSVVRGGVLKELDKFKKENQEWSSFGVRFSFIKAYENYSIIRLDDEEEEKRWLGRIGDVVEKHGDNLRNILRGMRVVDGVGLKMTLRDGKKIVLGAGGIVFEGGSVIYLKREMNIQEGLGRLVRVIGNGEFTVDIMRSYDFRTVIRGDSSVSGKK